MSSLRVITASGPEHMRAVRLLRAAAYARHVSGCWDDDGHDEAESPQVMLCLDGDTPAGTARLHFDALPIASDVRDDEWPTSMQSGGRAECSRLAVSAGHAGARLALWRAIYWRCRPAARWLIMGARSDALARMYRSLGAVPAFTDGVSLRHGGGLRHQILALDVGGAMAAWITARHPLLGYMLAEAAPADPHCP
ncbi:MAG: hypothetical protein RLZZ373_1025 [Pseudomonadota bacterium]|jgi:hypothetical protein